MKSTPALVRILVADDHDIVREGLRTLLTSQPGWQICAEATNGRQAVEKARQCCPDVAVLDLTMPELNGLEAARQIRHALPHTEVLVLTMHESEELLQEVFAAGARSYLLKTDARRYLVAAVEALAEHKPFFTPKVSAWVMEGRFHPETLKSGGASRHLTPREAEVLQLIVEGRSNKEIAATLGRSVKTVDAHRANLMNKLGLHSVTELVRYAIRHHIVQP